MANFDIFTVPEDSISVNVYTSKMLPLKYPITKSKKNIRLTIDDIITCLYKGAIVEEIKEDGTTVLLTKENIMQRKEAFSKEVKVEEKKVVEQPKPVETVTKPEEKEELTKVVEESKDEVVEEKKENEAEAFIAKEARNERKRKHR